jgi:hypothetical protein
MDAQASLIIDYILENFRRFMDVHGDIAYTESNLSYQKLRTMLQRIGYRDSEIIPNSVMKQVQKHICEGLQGKLQDGRSYTQIANEEVLIDKIRES